MAAQQAAEEAQRKADAAAQRKYIKERDAAPLKGLGTGTNVFGGPKGSAPSSATIKDIKPAVVENNLSGANGWETNWKRMKCASYITEIAVENLRNAQPDYDEFNYLAAQALHALAGDQLSVECPKTKPVPKFTKSLQVTRETMESLIVRSRTDADALKDAQVRRKKALDDLIAAKTELAALRVGGDAAAQKEIAALQAQRQALGPLTLKPAAAPPPPGAKKPGPDDASALLAKAAEAKQRGDKAKEAEAKVKSDIDAIRYEVREGEAEMDGEPLPPAPKSGSAQPASRGKGGGQ